MKFRYLALGLVVLLGSLFASSQRTSAYLASDRPVSSPAVGVSVPDTGGDPDASAVSAPAGPMIYKLYFPIVMVNHTISGLLTQNGAPIAGITVRLWLYNGAALATTTTNSSGFYIFTGLPASGPGQYYYVEYMNIESNLSRLSSWRSAYIQSDTITSDVFLGTSDLANISLVAPTDGATVALPYFFQWTRRSATPSDNYFMRLRRPQGTEATYGNLGYVSGMSMASLPNGWYPNVKYDWYVGVIDSRGGVGFSYYYNSITFSNSGADTTGHLDLAPQTTGRTDSPLPRAHPEK